MTSPHGHHHVASERGDRLTEAMNLPALRELAPSYLGMDCEGSIDPRTGAASWSLTVYGLRGRTAGGRARRDVYMGDNLSLVITAAAADIGVDLRDIVAYNTHKFGPR